MGWLVLILLVPIVIAVLMAYAITRFFLALVRLAFLPLALRRRLDARFRLPPVFA
jgi:hypothetical protein